MKRPGSALSEKWKLFIAFAVSILIAAAITAACLICVSVPSKSAVDAVDGVGESSATTFNNLTGDQTTSLRNDDVINYSYKGSYYSVTLPKGKFTFTLYGAQGGKAGTSGGGYGGKVSGTLEFTSSKTVYIYIGGVGTNSTSSRDKDTSNSTTNRGGWNGGGNGSGSKGPGGGGATDIRIGSTSTSNRVMVAAGGGGGDNINTCSTSNPRTDSSATGESGCHSRHSSSWPNDEGGGGGGYRGGKTIHGDDPYCGYAGSNFTGGITNYVPTGTSSVYKNNTGNGKAEIKVVYVNDNPTATDPRKGYTLARGTAQSVTPSAIAKDKETASGNLRFSAGNASNYDASLTTSNFRLYLNSGKNYDAISLGYITLTSISATSFTFKVNKYPRSGTHGVTTNGKMTLYVYVRDNYGKSTTRGIALIPFDVTVSETFSSLKTSGTLNDGGSAHDDVMFGISATTTAPTAVTATSIYNPGGLNRNTIMPKQSLRILGTNQPTAVQVTIKAEDLIANFNKNTDVALISIPNISKINKNDSTRNFKVREVDGESGFTDKAVTAYTTGGSRISNAYSQITLVGMKASSSYVVLPVTVYIAEKNSVKGTNYQAVYTGVSSSKNYELVVNVINSRPTLKGTAPSVTLGNALTKISLNTYYSDIDGSTITTSTHRITGVKVPTTEFIQLDKRGNVVTTPKYSNNYAFNLANSGSTTISSDLNLAKTSGVLGSSSPTGFESWFISNGSSNDAFVSYSYSGITLNLTGLRATYNMYSSARSSYKSIVSGSAGANITYSGDSVGNLGHFYILIQVQDLNDTSDTGIWLPLAITVNNAAPTNTSRERNLAAASKMPTAEGNKNAEFYFSPMGITIGGTTTPIGQYKNSSGSLTNANLQALASDMDNYNYASMLGAAKASASVNGKNFGKLNELITVTSSAAQVQNSVSAANSAGEYFTVSDLNIYIPSSAFGGRVSIPSGAAKETIGSTEYVIVKGYKIKLNNWTNGRYLYARVGIKDVVNNTGATAYPVDIAVKVNNVGLKVADTIATLNYNDSGTIVKSKYFVDTDGLPTIEYSVPQKSTVIVTPYDLLSDVNMETMGVSYPASGFTLNGISGVFNPSTRTLTQQSTTGKTPTQIAGIANAFNAVDYSGNYINNLLKPMLTKLNASRTVYYGNNNSFDSRKSASKGIDRLFFERTTDASNLDGFTYDPYLNNDNNYTPPPSVNGSYVDVQFGTKVIVGGSPYNIDYFMFYAKNRTPDEATAAEYRLTVRDRTGNGASGAANGVKQIKVKINVVNSTPRLKHPNKVYTLSVDPVMNGETIVTPCRIDLSAYSESASDLAILTDNEDTVTSFYTGTSSDHPNTYEVYSLSDAGVKSYADASGNAYNGNYLSVSVSNDVLSVTALNSSQAVKRLYVEFYATDNYSTAFSTLRLQFEVKNSLMQANHGANGFEMTEKVIDGVAGKNLWTVSTVNSSDKQALRYFASPSAYADLASRYGEGQVKSLTVDPDKVQSSVLATSTKAPTDTTTSDFGNYIPNIDSNNNASNSVNIGIYKNSSSSSSIVIDRNNPSNQNALLSDFYLIFKVNGAWKTRTELLALLADPATRAGTRAVCFDDLGRWKLADWAVVLKPRDAFGTGEYIYISAQLRDDCATGGDTMGETTAYLHTGTGNDDNTMSPSTVSGKVTLEFLLFVKDTGIITYDYYDRFNGYYTVADSQNTGINYISTFDNNTGTAYTGTTPSIYLNTADKTVKSSASDPGSDYIKVKDTSSGTDNTFAGINSGLEYTNAFDGTGLAAGESAFRYTNTIEVDSTRTVIPMSYFARRTDLVGVDADANVTYFTNRYVAYNIGGTYIRGEIASIADAIKLSDGNNTYSGWDTTDKYSLNNNPYVTIGAYDAEITTGGGGVVDNQNAMYNASLEGKYFNRSLAVSTIKADGAVNDYLKDISTADGYTVNPENAKNLVGNGHIMYLKDQATKLQENMFGITLVKKDARASSTALSMTISVANCQGSGSTSINYTESDPSSVEQNTGEIVFNLKIANDKIELDKYSVDLDFDNDRNPKSLELSRDGSTTADGNIAVKFSDRDTHDAAYFSIQSTMKFGWTGDERTYAHPSDSDAFTLDNTATNDKAQKSMRAYLGETATNVLTSSSFGESSDYVTDEFMPNDGKFGTANEKYSKYFEVKPLGEGNIIEITPRAKTVVNTEALPTGADRDAVKRYYAERGLVPEFTSETSSRVAKAYYPLRIVVYDDCGDGWDEASYVCLEIHVYISDVKTTLSSSKFDESANEYRESFNLSKGSVYTIKLQNIIVDADMLKDSSGALYTYREYKTLLDKRSAGTADIDELFKIDTGNYLVSPYSYMLNSSSDTIASRNEALRDGNAGLENYRDENNLTDVMMYMPIPEDESSCTSLSVPSTSDLKFQVNRRTTFTNNNNETETQVDFEFTVYFFDNAHVPSSSSSKVGSSGDFKVYLHVDNQAPSVRNGELIPGVTMRVNDYFHVYTTPYDLFNDGSLSARSSNSLRYLYTVGNESIHGAIEANALSYSTITKDNLRNDPNIKLHSYNQDIQNAQNLGYSAICTDDAPWTLRIKNVTYNSDDVTVEPYDTMPFETPDPTQNNLALNYKIIGNGVCENSPITFEFVDGEGGSESYTMFVTVESSAPKMLPRDGSQGTLNNGLAYTSTDNVFEAYMLSTTDADSTTVQYKEIKLADDITTSDGRTKVNAYSVLPVNITDLAYDPDKKDDESISMFVSSLDKTNVNYVAPFSVNGVPMDSKDGYYYSDNFRIKIAPEKNSFTIICTGFDSSRDWDEISFYVMDMSTHNNPSKENTIDNEKDLLMTIRISTFYGAMTNTHAANMSNASKVITGADTVYVKSYDMYMGNGVYAGEEGKGKRGVQSRYNLLEYEGMTQADAPVDQTAESGAYIVDPDVLFNSTGTNYDVRVFAFMNKSESADDGYSRATFSSISNYFDIDKRNGYFRLNADNADFDNADNAVKKYFVGGHMASGAPFGEVNQELLYYVNTYFRFDFDTNGVSMLFTPQKATFDKEILFYVEVTKKVEGYRSEIMQSPELPISAGTLFYVKVKDSAPIANTYKEMMTIEGKVGDSFELPIFSYGEDSNAALFSDSDANDIIKVSGSARNPVRDQSTVAPEYFDYDKALSGVPSSLWAKDGAKKRAIDISVDNRSTGDTPHTLTIKIVRRIDYVVNGVYQESFELPIKIEGRDRDGTVPAVTTVYLIIHNSDCDMDWSNVTDNGWNSSFNNSTRVGYTIIPGLTEKEYVIDAYVSKDTQPLTIEVIRWLTDPDFTDSLTDTDSYRLVGQSAGSIAGSFVVDDPVSVTTEVSVDGTPTAVELASIQPNFIRNDKNHFASITITAKSFLRNYTGRAYMRIIDRSGDADVLTNGVTFEINVHIINSAPTVISGKESDEYNIIGSETDNLESILINIGDYVTDPNVNDAVSMAGVSETYLRVTAFDVVVPDEIYSTGAEGADIVSLGFDSSNQFSQVIAVKPLTQFYGTQSVRITVSDGDTDEAFQVSFYVKFNITFDFYEIGALNKLDAVRGIPTKVTVDALVPERENNATTKEEMSVQRRNASEDDMFNPGSNYTVVRVYAPTSYVDYVTVSQDQEGNWQFVPNRVTSSDITLNAEFVLSSEVDNPNATKFESSFNVAVAENPKPVLIEAFESGYTFYSSGDGAYMLRDGKVVLSPENLFTDNPGDVVKFISASTKAPSLVTATVLSESELEIFFHSSGSTELTLTVADSTDESITKTFTIINIDLPKPSFWSSIQISFESNKIVWISVIAAIVLLIIILIIVIIALKHRKRKREELEAILISEMELEEQMMRLNAAQNSPQYQSYGFLPPTMPVQNDPSLMLGGGAINNIGDPNVLNLNPGQAAQQPDQTAYSAGTAYDPTNGINMDDDGDAQTPPDQML